MASQTICHVTFYGCHVTFYGCIVDIADTYTLSYTYLYSLTCTQVRDVYVIIALEMLYAAVCGESINQMKPYQTSVSISSILMIMIKAF